MSHPSSLTIFYFFLLFFALTLVFTPLGIKLKFFKVSKPSGALGVTSPISGPRLIGVGVLYLIVPITLGAILGIWLYSANYQANLTDYRWVGLLIQWLVALLLVAYVALLGREVWHWVWGWRGDAIRSVRWALIGALVACPAVWSLSNLVQLIVVLTMGPFTEEQRAVEALREWLGSPSSLTLGIITTVIMAPIAEEIVFRGFVQGWLRRHLSRPWAFWLTAFIFAACHFAYSQKWANLVIFPPLFLFGWYLSLLFEKVGSLWAPIFLHSLFNGITVLVVWLARFMV